MVLDIQATFLLKEKWGGGGVTEQSCTKGGASQGPTLTICIRLTVSAKKLTLSNISYRKWSFLRKSTGKTLTYGFFYQLGINWSSKKSLYTLVLLWLVNDSFPFSCKLLFHVKVLTLYMGTNTIIPGQIQHSVWLWGKQCKG